MAEVTRVPLQPIAKGSMMKFWLGLVVGIALTSAVAWFTSRPATVSVETITAGEGENPEADDVVFIDYTGKLEDGTVFDQSPPNPEIPPQIVDLVPQGAFMEIGGVVPGFRDALLQMQRGGSYTVEIPSELAYGSTPPAGSPIPADADLIFDVTLHDFMNMEELQERAAQIDMIMRAAQEAGELDEVAPPAPAG